MSQSTPSQPSSPALRRRFSPLVIVIGGAVAAISLFGLFAAVMIALQPDDPARLGIQHATLPDGTLLVLEAVTDGAGGHQFQVEIPQASLWRFVSRRRHTLSAHAPSEALVVWFSRRDPVTHRHLDFDWWSHSLAVDAHGCQFEDDDPRLFALQQYSSVERGGGRPLTLTDPQKYDRIVACSSVRPLRREGAAFPLKIYNTDGDVVAEFDVPDPRPVPEAALAAASEPLPITKSAGDLEVTLAGLAVRSDAYTTNGRTRERARLVPEWRFQQRGAPSEDWTSFATLSDPLGNTSDLRNCSLCAQEPAWTMHVTLFRKDTAEFAADEQWLLPAVRLSKPDQTTLYSERRTVNGGNVELAAVGGPGRVTYRALAAGGGGGAGGIFGNDIRFDIDMDTSYGSGGTTSTEVTVACERPHVAVRFSGLGKRGPQQTALRAVDDRQRPVPTHGPYSCSDVEFWFLDTETDAETVDLTFIVHDGRELEFVVAPPEAFRTWQRLSSRQDELLRATLKGPTGQTPRLAYLPAGRGIVSATASGMIVLHAFSPEGGTLLLEPESGVQQHVAVPPTGRVLTKDAGEVLAIAVSPDGMRVGSVAKDGTVAVWNILDGARQSLLPGNTLALYGVAFSPDGALLAVTGAEGTALLLDAATGEERTKLEQASSVVTGVTFSTDGATAAAGSWDRTFKVWDTSTGQLRRTFAAHEWGTVCVAISPDGQWLAGCGGYGDPQLLIWEMGSGREYARFDSHPQDATSAAFTPDGRTLLTAGWDGTLRLYDVAARRELATLPGAYTVSVAPDGETFATGGSNHTIRVWDTQKVREALAAD